MTKPNVWQQNRMTEAFNILQLAVRFDVDEKELQKRYHDLMDKWHPDRMVSSIEKAVAVERSKVINQAYHRLMHPLHRAEEVMQAKKWVVIDPSSDFFAWVLDQDRESFEAAWQALCMAFTQAVLDEHAENAGTAYGRMRYVFPRLQNTEM